MKILYLPNCYSQQRQFEKPTHIYPIRMAMEAEWYRKQGHKVIWDEPLDNSYNNTDDKIITKPENLPFLSLPHPDRVFTRWWEYQNNGNFKYHPATYILSASGCWHGKCSFCVEKGQPYEVRDVRDIVDEIRECRMMGFKEIFDDSATFPIGNWLEDFCRRLDKRIISLGCNMRIVDTNYQLMKEAGFRMLLFGLESANQQTLDRINKGTKVEDIKYIIKAAQCGLEPHISVMFSYPWETDQDALNTLHLVWWLLKKGYAKTAQASFYRCPNEQSNKNHRKYLKQIYRIAYSPQFWFNKLRDIHNVDDLKYLWRQIKVGLKEWR